MPKPIPPPRTTQTEPPVTANAFAEISSFGVVISGIPAESPARINLFTPNATKTKTVISSPVLPLKIKSAITTSVSDLVRLAKNIARWRENLSSSVPTNGPTTEYGRSTTANATAALTALACRSGEKRIKEASALWKIPSVICPDQRIRSKRKSFRSLSNCHKVIGEA